MNKSDSIAHLAEALSKAQGAIKGALKDSTNPFFRSKYADLASVWDACRKELSDNGLSVVQVPETGDGYISVKTILMHSSGEYVSGDLAMHPVKDDPQGVGSAITYARRYALSAFVGIAPEDDDGNAASGKASEPKRTAEVRTFGAKPNSAAVEESKGSEAAVLPVESMTEVQEQLEQSIEYIDIGRQKNFHSQFRKTIKEFHPDMEDKADDLLYQWLAEKGFRDSKNKLPSASAIPASGWFQTRDNALAYAKTLKMER